MIEIKAEIVSGTGADAAVGEAALLGAFSELRSRIGDLKPFWPKVSAAFYQIEREQFESEGERADVWHPLSPGYAQWKAINFPGEKILQATGDLFHSLTDRFNPDAIYEDEPDSLTVGSTLPYATKHQTGEGRLVARPEIQFIEGDPERLMKPIRDGMIEFGRRLGFEVVGGA